MQALFVALVLLAGPKTDSRLVGSWLLNGQPFVTLNANGAGIMTESAITWSTDGTTLTVVDADNVRDQVSYKVAGDQLTLTMAGVPVVLTRKGGAAAARVAPPSEPMDAEDVRSPMDGRGGRAAPPAQPETRAGAGSDQLSRLLMSSAWCSFSYNQRSGSSSTTRAQFFANGTWSAGGRGETYNSGANGSVAGQHDSSNLGQWAVKNGQLYMSNPPETPALTLIQPFAVTTNSNGYPIINSMGKEYSQCR